MRQWEKVRGWRERERERGREAVSNSVWSSDPLYGADNGVLPRVWRQRLTLTTLTILYLHCSCYTYWQYSSSKDSLFRGGVVI